MKTVNNLQHPSFLLGITNLNQGNFEIATQELENSYSYFQSQNMLIESFTCLDTLGSIQEMEEDYESSCKYYEKLIEQAKAFQFIDQELMGRIKLSTSLIKCECFTQSFLQHLEIMKIYESTQNKQDQQSKQNEENKNNKKKLDCVIELLRFGRLSRKLETQTSVTLLLNSFELFSEYVKDQIITKKLIKLQNKICLNLAKSLRKMDLPNQALEYLTHIKESLLGLKIENEKEQKTDDQNKKKELKENEKKSEKEKKEEKENENEKEKENENENENESQPEEEAEGQENEKKNNQLFGIEYLHQTLIACLIEFEKNYKQLNLRDKQLSIMCELSDCYRSYLYHFKTKKDNANELMTIQENFETLLLDLGSLAIDQFEKPLALKVLNELLNLIENKKNNEQMIIQVLMSFSALHLIDGNFIRSMAFCEKSLSILLDLKEKLNIKGIELKKGENGKKNETTNNYTNIDDKPKKKIDELEQKILNQDLNDDVDFFDGIISQFGDDIKNIFQEKPLVGVKSSGQTINNNQEKNTQINENKNILQEKKENENEKGKQNGKENETEKEKKNIPKEKEKQNENEKDKEKEKEKQNKNEKQIENENENENEKKSEIMVKKEDIQDQVEEGEEEGVYTEEEIFQDLVFVLINTANLNILLGKYQTAKDLYKQANQITFIYNDHEARFMSMIELAKLYSFLGKNQKSIKIIEQLQEKEEGDDDDDDDDDDNDDEDDEQPFKTNEKINISLLLSKILIDENKIEKSKILVNQTLGMLENEKKSNFKTLNIKLNLVLAELYISEGNYSYFVKKYEQILLQKIPLPKELSIQFELKICEIYLRMGNINELFSLSAKCCEESDQMNYPKSTALSYMYTGYSLLFKNGMEAAKLIHDVFGNALTIANQIGDINTIIEISCKYIEVLLLMKERKLAEDLSYKTFNIVNEFGIKKWGDYIAVLFAHSYSLNFRFLTARRMLNASIRAFKKIHNNSNLLIAYINYGAASCIIEDWVTASHYFQLSIDLSKKLNHRIYECESLIGYSKALKNLKQFNKSKEILNNALEIGKEINSLFLTNIINYKLSKL
ncbi:chascon isoform d-related [Anaeramoeba flamelloides]|uniref:Chascon isoform d-related n=1 Tax=Anaeramoeba flamelloides TaxID=1746091 RepID=A0AAV7YK15_9EUKA|nr:chascon isoform d-related [Anaeramoeba flamelloides]